MSQPTTTHGGRRTQWGSFLLATLFVLLPGSFLQGQGTPGNVRPGTDWVTPVMRALRLQYLLFDSMAAGTQVSYHAFTPPRYDMEPQCRFPLPLRQNSVVRLVTLTDWDRSPRFP